MQDAQKKIIKIVAEYKKLFKDEYLLAVKGIKQNRDKQANEYAEVKGVDTIQRAMYEMPETLYQALQQQLTPLEFNYWRTMKGTRWFITSFPEFSLTKSK